jgi:hypothetical protein
MAHSFYLDASHVLNFNADEHAAQQAYQPKFSIRHKINNGHYDTCLLHVHGFCLQEL